MHHHRRRSPAGRPGGGGDPQLPSARALQGQGREVRRRGHPAQGRQEEVIAMQTSKKLHNRRKQRVRTSIRRTANGRPRLSVFRSGKHIYAKVIDDGAGKTLVAPSSVERAWNDKLKRGADKAGDAEEERDG